MANPNEHQKARRLIQLQMDGVITANNAAWLENHLQGCQHCHQLSAQFHRLDAALRLDFQASREAAAARPFRSLPGNAFDPIRMKSRARMNTNLLKSFANTLVSIVLLAALTGGLIWVLSSQIRPPALGTAPIITDTPTPAATSTPLPSPTPVPLPEIGAKEQIIQTLQILANAEVGQFAGNGWAHHVSQDLPENGSGALQGTFVESWMRFDQGVCIEGYLSVKDRPDGDQLYQLLVSLPDGMAGDLAALRQGTALPEGDLPSSLPCPAGPAITDSGRLAARLERGAEAGVYKGPNDLQEVKAWYEDQDTRPVLVVEAVFTQTGSVPEVQRETRRFDLGTGAMLQEHIWMEWANGAPFGEMSREQRLEIVAELPPQAAEFYAQSAADLRTYIDPATGQLFQPTPTPLPVGQSTQMFNPLYTADDPLTDEANILSALEALHQQNFNWLSKPGWHLYTPKTIDPVEAISPYGELIHALPDGTCEWFTFLYRDGAFSGNQIYLSNGDWGIDSSGEGKFTDGEAGTTPCRIDNYYSITHIKSVIWSANEILSGNVDGEMRMWVEQRDGRPVAVLYRNVTYSDPKPSTLDPDTRQLEIQDRNENWDFFDMETGTPVSVGDVYQAYLANGKVFGAPYVPGGPTTMQLIDYDTLPDDLSQAFELAVINLKEYLGAGD